MTEQEFRLLFSQAIEQYQIIEFRLKAICLVLLNGEDRNWYTLLKEYEGDTLGQLITKLEALQNQKEIKVLTTDEIASLKELKQARNYWCHECFGGIDDIVVFTRGQLNYNSA